MLLLGVWHKPLTQSVGVWQSWMTLRPMMNWPNPYRWMEWMRLNNHVSFSRKLHSVALMILLKVSLDMIHPCMCNAFTMHLRIFKKKRKKQWVIDRAKKRMDTFRVSQHGSDPCDSLTSVMWGMSLNKVIDLVCKTSPEASRGKKHVQ